MKEQGNIMTWKYLGPVVYPRHLNPRGCWSSYYTQSTCVVYLLLSHRGLFLKKPDWKVHGNCSARFKHKSVSTPWSHHWLMEDGSQWNKTSSSVLEVAKHIAAWLGFYCPEQQTSTTAHPLDCLHLFIFYSYWSLVTWDPSLHPSLHPSGFAFWGTQLKQ